MTVNQRIQALRTHMQQQHIAMVVVPSGDAHLSEYVCDHFQLRRYLSGFTGSAGTLVVGLDWAGLWTDGRYHTQAATQLDGTAITLYPAGKPGVKTLHQEIAHRLAPGQNLVVDGRTISKAQGDALQQAAKKANAILHLDWQCPTALWPERPSLPQGKLYPIDNAGQSATHKLTQLRQDMAEKNASAYLEASLDHIAWLLNLRGSDLPHTPVFLSFLWVSAQSAILFVEPSNVTPDTAAYLQQLGVITVPYQAIDHHCQRWHGGQIWVDGKELNARVYQLLGDFVMDAPNPIAHKQALKTADEIAHLRNAHKKDAVAMVTFLHWLEATVGTAPLTEVSAAAHLDQLRSEQAGYLSLSFTTICGYGANGAIIHYDAQADCCATIEPHGLLLVDSGGQYTDGTTDITRTIPLGDLTPAMKRHYTLALKGHLALAAAHFPAGTTGAALDVLARQPLWQHGLDYLHGTGHGVGYRLGVHEGPQSISHQRKDGPAIEVGMVTSNEPGYYLPGSHGIRHENLLVCQPSSQDGFLQFEPLTLVPFDTKALDLSLMTQEDCQRLNDYHALVYDQIAPLLPSSLVDWLYNATRPVACSNILYKTTG